MEGIFVEYFLNSVNLSRSGTGLEFHSYTINGNEKNSCDSHAHMFHL